MTEAEKEELEVRKRRAEGTPCTKENFEAWKKKFEEEMALKSDDANDNDSRALKDKTNNKKKNKNSSVVDEEVAARLTGYEYFTQKGGILNLELLEKAAEEAAEASGDEDDVDDLDVDEDLFDDDDDLDDLDFDDEDDDEDYDDEDDDEEIDI